jgi:antitoxin ChpS
VYTTNLRKVGGSVMLSIPPVILEMLDLQIGETVSVHVNSGCLIIEPRKRPHYSLSELLAASDYATTQQPSSEREWVDAQAVGKELI